MIFSLEFKNKKNLIIFSLPKTNHYQEINNLTIISKDYKIIKENNYQNKIIVFKNKKSFHKINKINFFIKTKKNKYKIQSNLFLDQYKEKKFLIKNNKFINGEDEKIKKIALKIIKNEKKLEKVIKKIYDFTLDYLEYGKPIDGLYSYDQALKEKITDCGGFSTFLGSLLQSLHIPVRIVSGFIIKKNNIKNFLSILKIQYFQFKDLQMHAWLETQLPDGNWFPMDPSIEWKRIKGLTKKEGGFGYIPNDRLVVSYGADFKIKINKQKYKIDILQKPIYC